MSGTLWIAILILGIGAALFVCRAILGVLAYFGSRSKRLVTCPETHKAEAVDVAAGKAAIDAFLSEPTLRLKQCSRWPERQDCGQECLFAARARWVLGAFFSECPAN
jgi:hypothetical protein